MTSLRSDAPNLAFTVKQGWRISRGRDETANQRRVTVIGPNPHHALGSGGQDLRSSISGVTRAEFTYRHWETTSN